MARKSEEAVFEEEFETEVENVAEEFGGFEIDDDVALTARTRNGPRASKYPFDKLAVGQSFHVASTEDMPKPSITLAGAVTNANNKWSSDHPTEVETKIVSVFQLDEDGKRVQNEDGSYIKIGEQEVTRPARVAERHFTIRSVGNDDKRGQGARVFRDL